MGDNLVLGIYVLFLLVSFNASFVVAYMLRRNDFPGNSSLAGLFLGCALWSGSTAAALFPADSAVWQVFWNQVSITGVLLIALSIAKFSYEYTGMTFPLRSRPVYAFLTIPVLSFIFVWTNPLHHLMWDSYTVLQETPMMLIEWVWNDWFYVHLAFSYVLIISSVAAVVRFALTSKMYRGQSLAFATALLGPLFIDSLGHAGVLTLDVPITQATFFVTAGLVAFTVRKSDFVDAIPATQVLGRRELLANMSEGVLIVNSSGRVVDTNSAISNILSRPTSSITGEPVEELLSVNPGLNEETELLFEEDGLQRTYAVSASSIERHSESLGKLLVFREITDQKRKQQQLQVLNRALRHNLRNDLTVVSGYIQMLKDGLSPQVQQRDVDELAEVAEEALDICGELDEMGQKARLVEEIVEAESKSSRNLAELLRETVEHHREEYPNIDISLSIAENQRISSIPEMKNVFKELVENACVHNTGIEKSVSIDMTTENGTTLVQISDNGPGIPDHEMAVLTDSSSETQMMHSSGIGLWISRWTAELSGGSLSFEVTDEGSTVTVELPNTDTSVESGESKSTSALKMD